MPFLPQELGSKVSTRSLSWLDFPQRAWGSAFNAPDPGIYEWSNGRKFDSTDKNRTGLYGVGGDAVVVLDGQQYPDMRDGVYAQVGIAPGSANGGFGSYQEIDADPRS